VHLAFSLRLNATEPSKIMLLFTAKNVGQAAVGALALTLDNNMYRCRYMS
jgi:hypothetical protein